MLTGSIVALVTPFYEDGRINFEKLGELIEFHISNGTDGLLILGTTGESPTISFEEQQEIVTYTVKRAKSRTHIMVGSGCNDTVKSLNVSQVFESLGADSLLVITPYYNKTNESGMIKHFMTIADGVSIPVILYNVPGRTGCHISVEAVETLAKHSRIAGIKEASGDLAYVMSISRYLSDDFVMYSGNDDMIVPLLSVGAIGVISVWANLMPQVVQQLVKTYLDGETKESLDLQRRHLALIQALFTETNPIPIKHAMNIQGFSVGPTRLPLDELSPTHQETLTILLKNL